MEEIIESLSIRTTGLLEFIKRIRLRIFFTVGIYIILSGLTYLYVPLVMEYLLDGSSGLDSFVFLSPAEGFLAKVKMALGGGLILILPVVLYHVWDLFRKRLPRRRDRFFSFLLIPISVGLFVGGAAFGSLLVLPMALQFFMSFAGEFLKPMITVGSFVSFLFLFVIPFGLIFQLPIIIMFLAHLGIVSPTGLRRSRKYAILVTFILSAVLTPADVFSQVMMAIPVLILYEISTLVSRITYRQR